MAATRLRTWLSISLLVVTIGACKGGGAIDPGGTGAGQATPAASSDDQSSGGGGAGPEGVPAEAERETEEAKSGVGPKLTPMIASGQGQAAPTMVVGERPAQIGRQQVVGIDDAVKGVTFKLLEPKKLPKGASRDLIHLITAFDNTTRPELPAVRMVYSVTGVGAVVVHQSPATPDKLEGETVDLDGKTAYFADARMNSRTVTWDQDGVRIEVRGNGTITKENLIDIAKSLGPVDLGQPTPTLEK